MLKFLLHLMLMAQTCPGGGECVPIHPPQEAGPPIQIVYTTFIPLDHVRLTPPVSDYMYEADNQFAYFPFAPSFRVQQTLTVSTGVGIVTPSSGASAVSRLFRENNPTTNLSSSLSCYRKNCSNCPTYPPVFLSSPITFNGQCLIRSAADHGSALAGNMSSVTAQLVDAGFTASHGYVTVRLSGAPVIGISPNFILAAGSPHIDWDVAITITRDLYTGQTVYAVSGTHDGFPYHDIRINGLQVYARDSIPTDTPLSLFDPMEVVVGVSGAL